MRIILLFLLFYLSTRHHIEANCPTLCDQNYCNYGILFCSGIGLNVIPEIPPPKTTKITIANQRFYNPILGYRNLSKYGTEEINLKSLTIQNCSLKEIESESFSHLIHLTEMDLSHNDLRMIHSKTFKALTLKSLILDGNRLLMLASNSFQGLVVSSLSLGDCGLNELTFDSMKEISGHLTKLNLSRNRLKSFSRQFYLLFKRLEDIRLEDNQLKCDCRLKWLNDILKNQKQSISYSSIACFNPIGMRGKIIVNLEESQFVCPKPDLKTISVDISSKSAILYCSSSPSSDSFVSWHLKFKDAFRQIRDLIKKPQNASIKIEKSNQFDKYFCVVKNENGNVSVDLNIRWPDELKNDSIVDRSDNPVLILSTGVNESSKSQNSDQINNYLFIKQFTFLEMILSIGSTFVVTTITFALIYFFLSRRMNLSIGGKQSPNKTGYQGVIYSDSAQIYDSPRYSSPHKSFQTAHLLDFKTQKRLSEDLQ